MEFVSWDDDIPNIWINNPNVPNHQPDLISDDIWIFVFDMNSPFYGHGI
jgi:hypothetical protein